MLWATLSVVAAASLSRFVMRGHADWTWRFVAFGCGWAAGLGTAFMLGAVGAGLAAEWEEARGIERVLGNAWWVAALGAAAGLVASWRKGEDEAGQR